MNTKHITTNRLLTWPFVRPLAVALAAVAVAGGIAAPSDAILTKVQPDWFDVVGHVTAKTPQGGGTAQKRPGGTIDPATKRARQLSLLQRGDNGPNVYP